PAGEGDFESTVRIFYPPPCSDCSGNLPGAHADGSFLVLLVCMEIVSMNCFAKGAEKIRLVHLSRQPLLVFRKAGQNYSTFIYPPNFLATFFIFAAKKCRFLIFPLRKSHERAFFRMLADEKETEEILCGYNRKKNLPFRKPRYKFSPMSYYKKGRKLIPF
ncbi:MAG: hypothetical protein J5814_09925, partial [Bacteroidaceae bacterium]|nr:hypothetical protein [Bacteroidaceae bacterium]